MTFPMEKLPQEIRRTFIIIKIGKSKFSSILLIYLAIQSSLIINGKSWQQNVSINENQPTFTTHQWLAYETLLLFDTTAKISWIWQNLLSFWHGVEAAFNNLIAIGYDDHYFDNYGDINNLKLVLDESGTSIINDSIALRAQLEYEKLVNELKQDDINLTKAAFYMGALSHYISQTGFWYTLWNETSWGTIHANEIFYFEYFIEEGLLADYYSSDENLWRNCFFYLNATKNDSKSAYNATLELAKIIYPYVSSLGSNFQISWGSVDNWPSSYKDNVTICLTKSIEAIYSAIDAALNEADFKILTIPTPIYNYYNYTNSIEILDFQVYYKDNNNEKAFINNTNSVKAEFGFMIDDSSNQKTLSTERKSLFFNQTSNCWYYPKTFVEGLVANSNHTIVTIFQTDGSIEFWSNESNPFFVNYYNVSVISLNYSYDENRMRKLDIFNITIKIYDFPGIEEGNETVVTSANWFLYQKGIGSSQTGHVIGFPVIDTEGKYIRGSLKYNSTNNLQWHSMDNDIGLVYTQTNSELYIVVRFKLIIPVGFWKYSILWGSDPIFLPYIQANSDNCFRTRDHSIEQTKPIINYDSDKMLLDISGIKGWSDYNQTELDYYEIYDKEIYGDDRREARWKIFIEGGIQSRIMGNLEWSIEENYWFFNDININSLPDGKYYVAVKLANMNVNFTTNPWGPASEYFIVHHGIINFYYALPIYILVGFTIVPLLILIKRKNKQLNDKNSDYFY